MKYDCAVIGSGISGLSAALILARNRKRIAVIEKNKTISPMLRSFSRSGVSCNPGFHYSGGFHRAGPASVIFNYLGISEKIKIRSLPETGISFVRNEKFSLPAGFENLREALSSAFPSSRSAIEKYIDAVTKINDKTCFMNFEQDFGQYLEEFSGSESLDEFLFKAGAEKKLVQLLGNYGYALYGSAAHEAPFYLHAFTAASLYSSSSALEGGGDALANAFEESLRKNGVDIFPGNPVNKIRVDDKRIIQGVELADGNFIECRECIFTAHPGLLKNIIPENAVRPVFFKKLDLYENTFSPFVLFLEADNSLKNKFSSNFYNISGMLSKPDFLCVPVCDKKEALTVLKPCPEEISSKIFLMDDTEYHAFKEEYSEKIISEFTYFFPEAKGHFKVLEALSPRSYRKYTGSVYGSMYGLKKTVDNGQLNPVTDISGLYLAGQSIKVPGITGALVSALSACCNILDPVKLWKELKQYI